MLVVQTPLTHSRLENSASAPPPTHSLTRSTECDVLHGQQTMKCYLKRKSHNVLDSSGQGQSIMGHISER